MLSVSGLGHRYGPRWLFRDLGFELSATDRLLIRGKNGSGKSTLLRILAGLQTPTTGTVSSFADARTTVGYVALEMALYPSLTVLEHLTLAASLRGVPAREEELLETVALSASAKLLASQLSTGLKTRLKLALALQTDPSVLLLDEPGAGLDEDGRNLLDRVVSAHARQGVVVIASNDPDERRLANLELALDG
jgi:ABC-type multidrug transport system ATPase subunit